MSYTPMSDLGQQGLFDITRLLLQQPDLAALSETLTRLVQQSALADEAAIILWNAGNHRAARYACDEAGQPVSYEDETVLAHGPVRRLLSRPDALHCDHETFADTWPQLIRSGLYRPFGYYSLLPLAAVLLVLFSKSVWVTVLGNAQALFPYDQPALFSMPLAFLITFIVSKLDNSAEAQAERAAFEDQYVRAQTGFGAADASSH